MSFVITIVGRPNVGKSSLFNKLIRKKKALVLDQPGVTRDRIFESVEHHSTLGATEITFIDTGGLGGESFHQEIERQVSLALEIANAVLFIVDGRTGLQSHDEDILRELRKKGLDRNIPILGIVNKIDEDHLKDLVHDFYALGIPLQHISAEHGYGISDLWEKIEGLVPQELWQKNTEEKLNPILPRSISIIGKPNVGKSSLLNALIGKERSVVSNVAGTTMDTVDTELEISGEKFTLVDTAGIRRKNKTEAGIEVLSVLQSFKSIERSELCLFLMDGSDGVFEQDERLAGKIEASGSSVILVVNKWDTQKNNKDFSEKEAVKRIHKAIPFLKYAPILFISALKKTGLEDLKKMILEVFEDRKIKPTTNELTKTIKEAIETQNTHKIKVYYAHQMSRHPPTFVLHMSQPKKADDNLRRQITNHLRRKWGYLGTPLRIVFKGSKGKAAQRKKNSNPIRSQKKKTSSPKSPRK